MASRGLAAVYNMADEGTRKALLDSLMSTLSGEHLRGHLCGAVLTGRVLVAPQCTRWQGQETFTGKRQAVLCCGSRARDSLKDGSLVPAAMCARALLSQSQAARAMHFFPASLTSSLPSPTTRHLAVARRCASEAAGGEAERRQPAL